MDIDKVQLLILSILEDSGATTPGTGMTLREIANEVNKCDDHKYSQMTINRKVWALRDAEYISAKLKCNKADLLPIIKDGIYAPLEPNKRIKYIGLSQPDTKDIVDINSVMDVVGVPIDTFSGFGNTETVLYLAGLSFPKTYINSLAESIKAEQERVQKVMEDDDICMDSNINFLSKKSTVAKEPVKQVSARERLLASKNKK